MTSAIVVANVVRLRPASKFRVRAIAPSRGNGQDAMRASRTDIVGAVPDHDGIARVSVSQVQRGTNEVGFVAGTLGPIRPVNGVEVVIDAEVTYDQPGGFD